MRFLRRRRIVYYYVHMSRLILDVAKNHKTEACIVLFKNIFFKVVKKEREKTHFFFKKASRSWNFLSLCLPSKLVHIFPHRWRGQSLIMYAKKSTVYHEARRKMSYIFFLVLLGVSFYGKQQHILNSKRISRDPKEGNAIDIFFLLLEEPESARYITKRFVYTNFPD